MEDKLKQNINLSQYSTYRAGGMAEYFLEAETKDDVFFAFDWAKKNNKNIHILGGGSNVLVSDNGLKGLVLKMSNKNLCVKGDRIEAGAGVYLAKLISLAASYGFAGLEWGAGIIGASVGGSIRGNAGAFGQNIGQNLETVEVFNIKKNRFEFFSRQQCCFSYRHSLFKEQSKFLIWQATFKMPQKTPEEVKTEVSRILDYRLKRQPKLPSAGCVFKNLPLTEIKNKALLAIIDSANILKGDPEQAKVPAGWLIEKSGLKGHRIGDAKVSLEHANFIVNTSKAKAEDIKNLIDFIKKKVENSWGIKLEEEIQYLGFF